MKGEYGDIMKREELGIIVKMRGDVDIEEER